MQYEAAAASSFADVQQRLDVLLNHVTLTAAMVAVLSGAPKLNSTSFGAFIDHGISNVTRTFTLSYFAPRVLDANRADFEALYGNISDLGPVRRAAVRPVYHPTVLLHPPLAVANADVYNLPGRSDQLDYVMDTLGHIVSPRFNLFLDPSNTSNTTPGVTVSTPVFAYNQNASPSTIIGVAVLVVSLKAFFAGLVPRTHAVFVYDITDVGSDNGTLLYQSCTNCPPHTFHRSTVSVVSTCGPAPMHAVRVIVPVAVVFRVRC